MPVYYNPHVCGAAQLKLHTMATCMHATSHAPAQVSAYRLKLPPKRIFLHIQTPEFVEERRQQLDQYLQALLGAGNLANMPQVGTGRGLRVGAACVLLGLGSILQVGRGALGYPVPVKARVKAAWGRAARQHAAGRGSLCVLLEVRRVPGDIVMAAMCCGSGLGV